MKHVNLADAKAGLSALVDRAEAGEVVDILRRGKARRAAHPANPAQGRGRRRGASCPCRPPAAPADDIGGESHTHDARRRALLNAYLGTSLLVAALVPEAAAGAPTTGSKPNPRQASSSATGRSPNSPARAIKLRTRELTLDQRAAVQAAWTVLRVENLVVLPLTPSVFATAATFVDQSATGLCAGDALHLAVAAANGCAIATLDKGQPGPLRNARCRSTCADCRAHNTNMIDLPQSPRSISRAARCRHRAPSRPETPHAPARPLRPYRRPLPSAPSSMRSMSAIVHAVSPPMLRLDQHHRRIRPPIYGSDPTPPKPGPRGTTPMPRRPGSEAITSTTHPRPTSRSPVARPISSCRPAIPTNRAGAPRSRKRPLTPSLA